MQITACAVFIKRNKILLEKRKEDEDNYAGMWAIPGGHKRKGESIEHTLAREMKEELRIEIKDYIFLGKFRDVDPTSKKTYIHNAFLCMKWSRKIKGTTEEEKLKWFGLDEVKKLKKHRRVDEKIINKAKKVLKWESMKVGKKTLRGN